MTMRAEPLRHEGEPVMAAPQPQTETIVLSRTWGGWQPIAKRALDIVGAALLLLILAPALILLAVLIKLDSRGPIIFRQTRLGRNGAPFTFLKFRGMVADAEARKADLATQNDADGPLFKMRNDPRVTRVGRFIRKTSLDELPQLWNVLRGAMSLVGPRPPIPEEVAQYTPAQRDRLLAKPGMTGLWQVSGRSNVTFTEMVRLDFQYLERWSIWLDLKILLLTAIVVCRGDGAY